MCVVSMVGDHYNKWIPEKYPDVFPTWPHIDGKTRVAEYATKEEFEALKRTVEEMRELLKRAIKYDEDNHEPHCEVEEKMELLRRVAEAVGISLDDVIGKAA